MYCRPVGQVIFANWLATWHPEIISLLVFDGAFLKQAFDGEGAAWLVPN